MIYYRWMVEWRNGNGSGNAFVVASTEKEVVPERCVAKNLYSVAFPA